MINRLFIILIALCLGIGKLLAQDQERNVEERLKEFFANYTSSLANSSKPKLNSFALDYDQKKLNIHASESFAYQPFLPETVESIYRQLEKTLPGPICYFNLTVYVNGISIEELIPNFYRKKNKDKERLSLQLDYKGEPWVKNSSRPFIPSKGLEGRHIALWQSHGRYYNNKKQEWSWQRPRLFCTTEDLYTQSFLIPYLIPMLENSGAVVFTPRERDTQPQEVIVDNDTPRSGSLYIEVKSKKARWNTPDEKGFALKKGYYKDRENPFTDGTARYAQTEKKKNKAFAEWIPTIPETGNYAVYISYQTLPQSVSDAKYTVFHKGGATEFKVNQQIGSGTWVYLGTFAFDKGNNDYGMVILSNESSQNGIVCADAVRFGGGMGNIARGDKSNSKTSGLPRYLEGARYAAQWAGMPYSVYSGKEGSDDYADDINTRSRMTNYLSGGSVYNPNEAGVGIPFELTLGLHSDAGANRNDELIGSLGIYTSEFNQGKLSSGISRYASRDLTDLVLTGLKKDIESEFSTGWQRRGMWDKNYSETRLPAVPSMILELLSHQNFADMKMGHDPAFQFTVGRSVYKSILRFVTSQHGQDYVVQPLPVSHLSIQFGKKKNTLHLSWKAVDDPLEPSAKPRAYRVYTRVGYGDFDNGVLVENTNQTIKIEPGLVYSFKVSAVNRGGESFPSEILSAYKAKKEKAKVLIINGFNRISGPAVVDTPQSAGFNLAQDPGVPYRYNLAYCGTQTGFDRSKAGREDKGCLGYSGYELEGSYIAGNTFDYPFIHGKAIQAAGGYSFVSCSDEAAESGTVKLTDYQVVDLILGLEKDDPATTSQSTTRYKSFSSTMQQLISAYCTRGGNILVSGAYVGSDMSASLTDRTFTENVLKYSFSETMRHSSSEQITGLGRTISIPRNVNARSYAVVAPDCIAPVAPAFSTFIYLDGNRSAAIAYKEKYRTFVLGFPFESIQEENERANIMAGILNFFLTSPEL